MKNKGFTLIELLGVIVILMLLLLLVFPKIINSIKSSSKKVDDATLKMIYSASDLYLSENEVEYSKTNGYKYCISLTDLIEEEYLTNPINLYEPDEDITKTKSVLATYDDGYTFELKDNNTCKSEATYICEAVTNKTLTTGNIPKGNYELGDEYICEVKNGTNYHFFVLSTDDDYVNLIMDRNINKSGDYATEDDKGLVAWISKDDYLSVGGLESEWYEASSDCTEGDTACYKEYRNQNIWSNTTKGPITVMNYLYEATKDWDNVPDIIINYTDEGKTDDNGYGKVVTNTNTWVTTITDRNGIETASYSNLKTRLPNKQEAFYDCRNAYSCPLWKVNYLNNTFYYNISNIYTDIRDSINGIYGYWTLSTQYTEQSHTINNLYVVIADTGDIYDFVDYDMAINDGNTYDPIDGAYNTAAENADKKTEGLTPALGVRPVISIHKSLLKN